MPLKARGSISGIWTLLSKSTSGEGAETCNSASGPKVLHKKKSAQKKPKQSSECSVPPAFPPSPILCNPAVGWIYCSCHKSSFRKCLILNQFSFRPSENPTEFHCLLIYRLKKKKKKRLFLSVSEQLTCLVFFLFSKVNNERIFC